MILYPGIYYKKAVIGKKSRKFPEGCPYIIKILKEIKMVLFYIKDYIYRGIKA